MISSPDPVRPSPVPAQRMGAVSHVGRREANEDSYVIYDFVLDRRPDQLLAVIAVADGMGGHSHGAAAARTAIGCANRLLDSDRGAAGIRSVVGLANHLVIERGQSLGTSIGTTLTLAVVEPGVARIGHVGDSRAYLIHRGAITQITEDHSLVAELVREGTISEEDAREHEQRNVLRRAVGVSEDLEVDIFEAGIAPGDTLALCTDGLSTMVRPEEILAVVDSSPSMEEAASKLVSLAYQRGGDDNITAILWRYPGGLDQVRQTLVSSPPTAARSSLRAEIRILRTAFATAAGLMGLALGLVLGWLIRKGFP